MLNKKNIIEVNSFKPYSIHFESLKKACDIITNSSYGSKALIIYDTNLPNNQITTLKESLEKLSKKVYLLGIKGEEHSKSFNKYIEINNFLLENNFKKQDFIVNLGGGVIGDLGAFVASTYLRGIDVWQIPTSLLAMVDSSIGGKNAINTEFLKNCIGTIYPPKGVIIDISLLSSLSKRHFLAGYAECLKYGICYKEDFFHYLENNIENILSGSSSHIKDLIYISCICKKEVVEEDELEQKNIRYILNLGHTFGHAFERLNNYQSNLLHGEAVSIGIVCALKASLKMGLVTIKEYDMVISHMKKASLPTTLKDKNIKISISNIVENMKNDKKNKNNNSNLTLVLPTAIGKCEVNTEINENIIESVLKEII